MLTDLAWWTDQHGSSGPVMSKAPDAKQEGAQWEPIIDIPDNLRPDGSNYVEWVWALLDDEIDIPLTGSFAKLLTPSENPLLDDWAAAHLDKQLATARLAADERGHALADVVVCCRPEAFDAGELADDLYRLFFSDSASALARARAIGEICDVAEEYRPEAFRLKMALATDSKLPLALRRAVDSSCE
jgi:hypothetical protein